MLSKVGEFMLEGPSIVLPRKVVVNKTHIRKSTNGFKSIVGICTSQLFPYSTCQSMPRGLYTRHEIDADLQRAKPLQNKSRIFEKCVMLNIGAEKRLSILKSGFGTIGLSGCFSPF